MLDIFIPSYHRAKNNKTLKYFLSNGYPPENIHVFIDSEAGDKKEYEYIALETGTNLHVFNMEEARSRYDYIHRPSEARRSAGQARNTFYDYAESKNIKIYCVQDDDTTGFEIKKPSGYLRIATFEEVSSTLQDVASFIDKWGIGCFGLSQTGDFIGGDSGTKKPIRHKVMNTTFINTDYIYRGERGVQDNDTSQFAGILNEGFFTGSLSCGVVLKQAQSATQKGGLTDLYNECKLLNKSLVVPIQFPSACYANKQKQNGNRMHHRLTYKNLSPKLLKVKGRPGNIAWGKYEEDGRFTNEPKRLNNAK